MRPRRRGSAGTEGRLRRGWRRGPGRSGAWGGSGKSYAKALEKRGFDAEAQEKRGEARIGADWREEAALRWASAGSEWTRVSAGLPSSREAGLDAHRPAYPSVTITARRGSEILG